MGVSELTARIAGKSEYARIDEKRLSSTPNMSVDEQCFLIELRCARSTSKHLLARKLCVEGSVNIFEPTQKREVRTSLSEMLFVTANYSANHVKSVVSAPRRTMMTTVNH